uniref:SHSP domain-containing protein n=1 Tax=Salmo trutta TaxID=8032 RepID=A0A673YFW7_SALTR
MYPLTVLSALPSRPNKWHCDRSSCQYGCGQIIGGSYYMSADVSQFEPQDIVVMDYNPNIVIHAEKVLENGSVSDTFTHKTMLLEEMDPLSVSGTLTPEGMLVARLPALLEHAHTYMHTEYQTGLSKSHRV